MKVVGDINNGQENFNDVKLGDLFVYGSQLYMRVRNNNGDINYVVDVKSGVVSPFSTSTKVSVRNAELRLL